MARVTRRGKTMKKLSNPILKHFGYQIIKKSKKKKKGWKQQGRGTRVTFGSASDPQNKMLLPFIKATTAPSRPERQAPPNPPPNPYNISWAEKNEWAKKDFGIYGVEVKGRITVDNPYAPLEKRNT